MFSEKFNHFPKFVFLLSLNIFEVSLAQRCTGSGLTESNQAGCYEFFLNWISFPFQPDSERNDSN